MEDFEICRQEDNYGRGCYLGIYLQEGKPIVDFYLEDVYSDGGVNVVTEMSYQQLLDLHSTTKDMLDNFKH